MKKYVSLEQIYKKIRKRGYKVSKARAQLIQILLKSDEYLSINKVAKKLKHPNVSSLYNNIWFLEKLKIVDIISHNNTKMFQIPYDPDNFSSNFTGYYVTKNNKIRSFNIDEELKSIRNKLSDLKIEKVKIIVSEK